MAVALLSAMASFMVPLMVMAFAWSKPSTYIYLGASACREVCPCAVQMHAMAHSHNIPVASRFLWVTIANLGRSMLEVTVGLAEGWGWVHVSAQVRPHSWMATAKVVVAKYLQICDQSKMLSLWYHSPNTAHKPLAQATRLEQMLVVSAVDIPQVFNIPHTRLSSADGIVLFFVHEGQHWVSSKP